MGLFEKKTALSPISEANDEIWLSASESRYRDMIHNYYGSPETIARGGFERFEADDVGTALFFLQKSIDLLHTLYVSSGMQSRRPGGGSDEQILFAYLEALSAVIAHHPNAPVDSSVREVTHRLRSIANACETVNIPSVLYRNTLRQLGQTAPGVDISDVLWT